MHMFVQNPVQCFVQIFSSAGVNPDFTENERGVASLLSSGDC